MLQLMGFARLGRDAELRTTQGGESVCNLSLAFTYYGAKSPDGRRPTQWVEGTLWGKQAEALAQYLTSGTGVCVVIDDAHVEEFDRRDGTKGSKLVGRVSKIELAGSRGDADSQSRTPAPKTPERNSYTDAKSGSPPVQKSGTGFDDMDDDIPF